MSVYTQDWDDAGQRYRAENVRVAGNGVVEVECEDQAGGRETRAWWRWKCEGAADLYGYIEQLQTLAGWQPEMRELIFTNLEARRVGRVQRWLDRALDRSRQGKGSAFKR